MRMKQICAEFGSEEYNFHYTSLEIRLKHFPFRAGRRGRHRGRVGSHRGAVPTVEVPFELLNLI